MIDNNDSNENPYNFAVRGTGTGQVATAGITVTPMVLTVAEAGGTGTFNVVLKTQPSADVRLHITSSDRTVVTLDGTTPPTNIREVMFTTGNWNIPQTVTVRGVNDDEDNPGDERMTTIQMTVLSADNDYNTSVGEDVVTVTVTDDDDEDEPTGPTGPGPGGGGGGGGGSAPQEPEEETQEEMCSVSDVSENDDDSLMEFVVECAAGEIAGKEGFAGTLSLLEDFREERWNDGETYLVLLTGQGGVYFHAEDRTKEDLNWSALRCEGGGSVLETEGCFIEYDGERSGYAHPFTSSHFPLTHGEKEFILLGGFDESPGGSDFPGDPNIGVPTPEAGDVDTDEELKGFVGSAKMFIEQAIGDDTDPAQLRGILRMEPWREGDVYIYIMDEMGRVIFDGGDREKEHTETGYRLVAVDGPEEYTEDSLLIMGYAVRILSDDGDILYIVGSGYRVEEQPERSDSGGGGCAVGGDPGGGAFGLLIAAFALLGALLIKRRSLKDAHIGQGVESFLPQNFHKTRSFTPVSDQLRRGTK